MSKKNKKANIKKLASDNIFLLKIAFKVAPLYTINRILDESINRVCIFIEHVLLIGYIIDAILSQNLFTTILSRILLTFLAVVLFQVLRSSIFSNYINPIAEQKIKRHVNMLLYNKATNLDLSVYDTPDFYNDFVWSMNEASSRTFGVLGSVSKCLGAVINIIVTGGFILSKDVLGIFIVAFSFFGIMILGNIKNRFLIKRANEMLPHQRKQSYIGRIMYLSEYAKELRLNRIKGKINNEFVDATDSLKQTIRQNARPFFFLDFFSYFIFESVMVEFVYLLYLMYNMIVRKTLQYGTLVILYYSCWQIRHSLSNLASSLPEFQEHSMYIEKVRKFLNYQNVVSSKDNPLEFPKEVRTIEFKHVSFSYDTKEVLKDINFKIEKGNKIAVVGLNGSGKTTLTKLLLRLYNPKNGEILINGININEFSIQDYRKQFSTVFQDFQLFAVSIGENIVADTELLDLQKAQKAVELSMFSKKLSTLEKKYETQLTKEFDENGILLSGGQAQSLSISRAFYDDAPIIIMDEPSSALDVSVENTLNSIVLNADSDKTVLIISHRLSTIKGADFIYYFEDGQITEKGTHDTLMKERGKYAEMFTLQASKYNIVL